MNLFYLSSDVRLAAAYHLDVHVTKMILETAQLLSTAHRELDGEPQQIKGVFKDGAVKEYKKPKSVKVLPEEKVIGGILYPTVYMATHINHPSALWVRESKANYLWASGLMLSLGEENLHRFGKVHKTIADVANRLVFAPNNIPNVDATPLKLATGGIDLGSPVVSYQAYYSHKCMEWILEGKGKYLKYTNRNVPEFMQKTFDKLEG